MKTFYKLADKHLMNKHGVLSQTNNYKFSEKKNSAFSKALQISTKLIKSDSDRYTKIDELISKFKKNNLFFFLYIPNFTLPAIFIKNSYLIIRVLSR